MRSYVFAVVALTLPFRCHLLHADEGDLREQAASAMKKAASFYREQISSHGGYVYFYSFFSLAMKNSAGLPYFSAGLPS